MNRYFKEVLDAHELIRSWLGNKDAHDDVCEELLARFSPAYSMVTPGGAMLDFTALNTFFRTQRGVRPGLDVDICDMQIVAESESNATVIYKERQQLPGQSATLRFSTVVFEVNDAGNVMWRHLHETSLPQS
ncbi:DUF4440 domain-containing protein [Pantoea agglomerans]|uniref:DUF4440 domain-containing protein n=1 Tax=Enterobacter agglomerans TaxID=549 RepID=UPI003D9FF720